MPFAVVVKKMFGFGGSFARFAKGSAWSGFGYAVQQGASLLTTILVARMISREEFGKYSFLLTTLTMWSVVASFGLGSAVTKYVSDGLIRDQKSVGSFVGGSITLALGFAFVSSIVFLVCHNFDLLSSTETSLSAVIPSACLMLFFLSLNAVQVGILNGLDDFRASALTNGLRGAVTVALIIPLTSNFGVSGAIDASAVGGALSVLAAFVSIRARCRSLRIPIRWAVTRTHRSAILGFALPSVVGGGVVSIANWIVVTFIARSGEHFADVASYAVTLQMRNLLLALQAVTGSVLLPLMSSAKNSEHQSQILWSSVRLNVLVGVGSILLITCFRRTILGFYGETYQDLELLVALNTLPGLGILAAGPFSNWLAANDRQWTAGNLNILWALLFVGLSFLATQFGLRVKGVALASALSYLILIVCQITAVIWIRQSENLDRSRFDTGTRHEVL